MDHHRIAEINAEMSGLLEQQKALLKDTLIARLSAEDLHTYTERNQRIRDLCAELMKVI
jgi:hypothetical protein